MQDRYAGDIGDFVKLTILRRITPGLKTGIIWWLHPNESHNADGKHITYLDRPQTWRRYDPHLFDRLKSIVSAEKRSVAALQRVGLINDAIYFDELMPTIGKAAERRLAREQWFSRALNAVADCNVVFLDPDNGLETMRYDSGRSKAAKSVSLTELQALQRPGRTLIVYHHHTRMPGGNLVELAHWGGRLAALGFTVDALRASVGTARAFFLLNASPEIRQQADLLSHDWGDKLSWHPNLDQSHPNVRPEQATRY